MTVSDDIRCLLEDHTPEWTHPHQQWSNLAALLLLLFLAFWLILIIYRIWFHPLSHIPGPRLAAATYLYHAYYQVYKGGMFFKKRPELLAKYGPVVRISPTNVEIYDPELYHSVYGQKSQYLKDPQHYRRMAGGRSSAFALDPQEHRLRRKLINPMLSKKAVNDAADAIIYGVVDKFISVMEKLSEDGNPIPIANGFYCVTVDIISAYLFGEAWNMLDEPGLKGEWLDSLMSIANHTNLGQHFPGLVQTMLFLGGLFPSIIPVAIQKHTRNCTQLVQEYLDADKATKASGATTAAAEVAAELKETPPRKTLMDAIVNPPPSLANYKTSFPELVDESLVLMVAGTDTTAVTVQYATWHFISKPDVKKRVLSELTSITRDSNGHLPLADLEALPYFSGFICETLRHNVIVPGRLPRIVPAGGITVPKTNTFLPPGTSISFCTTMIHNSSEIWGDDAGEFKPERWVGNPGLDKWLLSFSKGDRNCAGINLAYAELYLVLANLFTAFEMQPYMTTEQDMQSVDCGLAVPRKRLMVVAKRKVERPGTGKKVG
ncbi:cytochrome P450 [Wilcoxina mikolae CBS 423.85]|nr:cytochrome P450 [Wilcoxina mikolae CBS 423.85]